jgi:hypothetical protein
MSDTRSDIIIRDREGQPIAAVEVKNREVLSPEIATTLRRNLAVHGQLPSLPFFLLVSPEVGYLWKDVEATGVEATPTHQFPFSNVLMRYHGRNGQHRLSGEALEQLVFQWLINLTLAAPQPAEEPEKTLTGAGFTEAIIGGKVEFEVAV